MTNFRKSRSCPTSEELLGLANGRVNGSEGLKVARHLSICEFCAAEISLYESHPVGEIEPIETPPIPAPMHDLALALLKNDRVSLRQIESLLRGGSDRRKAAQSANL